MNSRLHSVLAPVRWRQWLKAISSDASWGLLAAAALTCLGALGRLAFDWNVSTAALWSLLAAGPAIGALVGAFRPQSLHKAAVAVDARYALKDRALSALSFQSKPAQPALASLQMADALAHLERVEAREVVSLRAPRPAAWGGAGALIAVGLLLWPVNTLVEAGPAAPLPEILAQAEIIAEDLRKFDDLLETNDESVLTPDEDLTKLVEELRELVEELKQPGVDEREALAKLSEMQAALQAEQAKYNVAVVDAQMKSLGDAMMLAKATESAGKALVEAKYDKAAQQLEQMEEPELDRKESRTLEEKLKKVAQEAGEIGLGTLSEAASEMAEGAKGGKGAFSSGSKKLANQAKAQARRKTIKSLLASQCDRLSECKGNCSKNSLVKGKKPAVSKSPSSNFGMSTSGNELAERTAMLGEQQLEQITGQMDEGESEVETTHSLEGREQAQRGYKEVYEKYKKLSDSVLDNEPIPLGQRQMIRKYFELIRPHSDEESGSSQAD
ncbi:MAG: hypothetical protein EHM42_03815 [Planctomycetaceae bacterium]|nr:MAG: hypothetical protein EHM42_03815 [Planctomycetaceae bacterium]